MSPGETVSQSLLDKPLRQITKDDISQLTREDCRRYLKEKGMRRPSWNKSQAIQQVISLKALFETASDSDATEARKKLYSVPSNLVVSVKETNEQNPYCREDLPKSDFSSDSGRLAADNDSVSPSTTITTNEPVGQMTIFYCGKVNTYDDVPHDKAQAIMQLAANPLPVSQEAPSDGSTALWSIPGHLQPASIRKDSSSSVLVFPTLQTVKVPDNCQPPWEESNISPEDSRDGPTSRKASVQRYREKHKDSYIKL